MSSSFLFIFFIMKLPKKNDLNVVYIYTDGACKGNPGPGGWGAILKWGTHSKELNGACADTTNNIMELTAVIEALKSLNRKCKIILTTDSTYVKNGITEWIHNWKKQNWKTKNKKMVKNKEFWLQLDLEVQKHQINWVWVKGHTGHPENERADELANLAVNELIK